MNASGLLHDQSQSKAPRNADAFSGPVFIVGMPRSGTKLMRGILNGHSRVAIPLCETECLPYWASHWQKFSDLSDFSLFRAFYETAAKTSFFHYMHKQGRRGISAERWHAACRGFSVGDVFEALVRIDANAAAGTIWGDKSPSYIRHIPLLKKIYPEARVIHIIRDVRDYCVSINRAWGKNMMRAAQRWSDDVSKAHADMESLGEDGMEILYEDLLDDPAGISRRVCCFLGIEFEDSMTELSQATENIGDAKGISGIVNDNKEKWKSRMAPGVVRKIEALTWPALRAIGYPTSYAGKLERLGRFRMRWYQLLDGWNLVIKDLDGKWQRNLLFHMRYFRVTGNRVK